MSSRSQFPDQYRREGPQLQAVLAGEHAVLATAVAHSGLYHAKQYPTDIEDGNRLHHLVVGTTMGIDRSRVLAEASARNALSVIDDIAASRERQYAPASRKDYNRLASAVEQVRTGALAVQPDARVFEAARGELAYEVLGDEIAVPQMSAQEEEAWVREQELALLTLGAAHPDLLYRLSVLCSKAAEKAGLSAQQKARKANDEEHKRFRRVADGFTLPLQADAVELGRSEVQLRRQARAEELAARVYSEAAAAGREGKALADYVADHRGELEAALHDLREGPPHLVLDNLIPVEVAIRQVPEPTEAPRELMAKLYAAVAAHGGSPAAVAASLFDAIIGDIEDIPLDPVLAIHDYLADPAFDDTTLSARATDELLAPALATHAEKASALIRGELRDPVTYIVHTSPFQVPFFSGGMFEAEIRVDDDALRDVVVVVSLYPYELRDLCFYEEARAILTGPDASRYYAAPERRPKPLVSRIRPGSMNGQMPSVDVELPEPLAVD